MGGEGRTGIKIIYSITQLGKLSSCHVLLVERKKQASVTYDVVGKRNPEAERSQMNHCEINLHALGLGYSPSRCARTCNSVCGLLGKAGGRWLTSPRGQWLRNWWVNSPLSGLRVGEPCRALEALRLGVRALDQRRARPGPWRESRNFRPRPTAAQ